MVTNRDKGFRAEQSSISLSAERLIANKKQSQQTQQAINNQHNKQLRVISF